jgi:hypothetical protein
MSTINTILIKRRLESSSLTSIPQLSGGELAFSEKNHTLYYGGQYGTLTIGGSGAFVHLEGDQTIAGNKTFSGTTTLSSTTFSLDSLIDIGGNLLTNVAYPSADADAATKKYVDDNYVPVTITGDFVNRTDAQDVSGVKTFYDNAIFREDVTINGDLTVLGDVTQLETNVSTTSAFEITNEGSQTALKVTQTDGVNNIAEFIDGTDTAMIITGTGTAGQVAIGTDTPESGVRLTVNGSISSSSVIYADSLQIAEGVGASTLYVETGLVGINTETPNEALTVSGNISASGDVYGVNGNFSGSVGLGSLSVGCFSVDSTGNVDTCGTLDVSGASTFYSTVSAQGTLTVDSASTFGSSVSAAGALIVDGTTTLNDDLTVTDAITVNSSANANTIVIDGTNHAISIYDNVSPGGPLADYKLTGISTGGNGFTIETDSDGGAGINFTPFAGSNTNVTQGDLAGNGSNSIINFIIDGGTF